MANAALVLTDDGYAGRVDEQGRIRIERPDGSIIIRRPEPAKLGSPDGWFGNLALGLPDTTLSGIAQELLLGIEADIQSRSEWETDTAKAIRLLGLKIKEPRADADASGAEGGIAQVDSPLLLEAVLRFQANAVGELLPAAGPVKVRDDNDGLTPPAMGHNGGPPLDDQDGQDQQEKLARALEADFNHYLAPGGTATEYYPDTKRMLFRVGFVGCSFKKIYNCPRRRRPVSESVAAEDIIVNNGATDLKNAGRVTHRLRYRQAEVKRLQLLGVYREVSLSPPSESPDPIQDAIAETQGFSPRPQLPQDHRHTIYECYCELDLPGAEHKDKDDKPTGLPLPFKVSIDKDSRIVLEIRRDWDDPDAEEGGEIEPAEAELTAGVRLVAGPPEIMGDVVGVDAATVRAGEDQGDDEEAPQDPGAADDLDDDDEDEDDQGDPYERRTTFVKFGFVPALGFYDIGLAQILGNTTNCMTGVWRLLLDAGMFTSFPGFLYAEDQIGRQQTNTFRVPPGGGAGIQTGGRAINTVVAQMPYPGPSAVLIQLAEQVAASAQRLGGVAELAVGEGRQDAPVGTTIALIEQATKVVDAVHKGLHASQAEEFQVLRARFRENPRAFWCRNKKAAVKWHAALLLQALDDCDLVPAADPNTPSQMHRILKAVAVKQLQAMSPQLYDARKVDSRILRSIGWSDPEDMFAPSQPPQGPQDNPEVMLRLAELQQREREQQRLAASEEINVQQRDKQIGAKAAEGMADRASKEKIAAMGEQTEMIKLQEERERDHQQAARERAHATPLWQRPI